MEKNSMWQELHEISTTWSNLPKDLSDEATLFQTMFSDENYDFRVILLLPNAKIPFHQNSDNECEWYMNERTGETFTCHYGESFEFTNDTDSIMILLHIKVKRRVL